MKQLTILLPLSWLVLSWLGSPALCAREEKLTLAQVQELLDTGQTELALENLDRQLKKNPNDSQALLLRSTAYIIDGDLVSGRRDLVRCLEIDPRNRQGWLNRAALDLAESDYEAAVDAFTRAEILDPQAPDNSLNIGAALLLGGNRELASRRFRSYLETQSNEASAYYLVAANYAMADLAELAVPLLRRAFHLDEKTRLRVRTDANFSALADNSEFQDLLNTDAHRLSAGSLRATRRYEFPYTGRDSRVLEATLTALQRAGYPIIAGVEVTPNWALVWSDVRIKIASNENDGTDIFLSAEPGTFTPETWSTRTEDIFRRIALELSSRLP